MKVTPQRKMKRMLSKATLWLSAAAMLVIPFSSSAFAGKEGVFISNSVYFTLDDVTLTSGADNGSLRFTLELNNDSGQNIDFNRYGVKIIDSYGIAYPAQLSVKGEARVKPNQKQSYKFVSQVPLNVRADELKADIFQWDSGNSSYMKDLGALSVAKAIQHEQASGRQVVLDLKDIDVSMPQDALVSVELGTSYRIYKDGAWVIYSDLWLQNLGSTSFRLPAALEYNMIDSNGYQYAAELIAGANVNLLPKQKTKVKLQAAIPAELPTKDVKIDFNYKAVSETRSVGALNMASSLQQVVLGQAAEYPSSVAKGIQIWNSWSSVSSQSDGLHIQSSVTLSNKGTVVIKMPVLAAEFQTKNGSISIASTDNATRSSYLSPGAETTYHYSGVLPASLKAEDIQLVILEQQNAGQTAQQSTQNQTLPVFVGSLAGASIGKGSNAFTDAKDYTLGTELPLDTNSLIDSNLAVSLVEFHLHDNEEYGYKTAIAKYKVSNKGTAAVTLPNLQTELASAAGFTYSGTRQAAAAQQVLPNTSYVLSYSYLIPPSEAGDELAMNFYDANRTGIGSFKVKPQEIEEEGAISFYPFEVNLKDYRVSATYSNSNYAYKLWANLEISRQEEVIVDANFSKLTFEVNDVYGRVLSSLTMPFVGSGKVVSGTQTLNLGTVKSEQLESIVTINMYEQIQTANGIVKRLVKVIEP